MEEELCKLEEQLKCPLCKNTLYDPAILVCGHLFCYDCICYGIEFGVRDVVATSNDDLVSTTEKGSSCNHTGEKGSSSSTSVAAPKGTGKKKTPTTASVDAVTGTPSPGKRRPRAKTFMCPICEQPAYKWTVNKVPQLQNFLEALRGSSSLTTSKNE